MNNILLIAPRLGNGGIQSWTKKILKVFSNEAFHLTHVNVGRRRSIQGGIPSKFSRSIDGMLDMIDVYKETKKALKSRHYDIMHTTTSGNLGVLRDFILNRLCHRCGVKTVLHCHFGCIKEEYYSAGFWGRIIRKTMREFDQVWVLDSHSEKALNEDSKMQGRVFLTPNPIEVPQDCDLSPKTYKRIAFVGNLIPSKGLYELISAVVKHEKDIELLIVGPGRESVIKTIEEIAGNKLNNQIKILGKLPNEEAVELMKTVDIIALPTYFPAEAFPISILEAMSRGKLVISCPRAAVPDMLTALDGSKCGILVREKSVDDIVDVLRWCQENKEEADKLCKKAYEKVYTAYRMDVIYELYRNLYRKLL